MQEEVLKLVLLALEDGSALSRKVNKTAPSLNHHHLHIFAVRDSPRLDYHYHISLDGRLKILLADLSESAAADHEPP